MITHFPHDNDLVHEAVIREQIHRAFDHVALSLSCSLIMLLQETRSRGIYDDSVQHILTLDASDAASGGESDMLLQLFRSNAGVIYVTRNTPPPNERVSPASAFTELQ